MSKILVSYAYFRDKDLAPLAEATGPAGMMFGDSGAHSARTLGIHIGLPTLIPWLRKWDHLLTVYASLDVIGAPEATWNNQKALQTEGLYPLPAYHTGESLAVLDRYIETGHRYIALGKLLGNPRPQVMAWLTRVFTHTQGSGVVFHGFGMTVWDALLDFPFYSVDSSYWTWAFKYARLQLFDAGTWVMFPLSDKDAIRRHWNLIEAHGGHPSSLIRYTSSRDRTAVARISATAFRRSEVWLRRRHHVPLPASAVCPVRRNRDAPTEPPPGPHIYLADTGGPATMAAALTHAPEMEHS